ncbi:MAG: hypothetical protein ACOCX2_14270 [Armatimonadota bacterium]
MIDAVTAIEFTDNYEDLSDENGFRFRFYCGRCDADFQSDPEPCPRREESDFLKVVGKIFVDAAENTGDLASDEEGIQHDVALKNAVTEVREHFHECPICGEWVCDVCWNRSLLICEKCAPSGREQHGGW